jgi:hypothetical protein
MSADDVDTLFQQHDATGNLRLPMLTADPAA